MKVVWTPLAEEQVTQFIGSMRADRTGAAWRWLQALLGRIRGLSRYPRSGTALGELDKHAAHTSLREIFFDPCRIVYRLEADRLVILAVRSSGAHRKSPRYVERPREARRVAPGRSSTA
jgi:plasmid stabilization system protein ParE